MDPDPRAPSPPAGARAAARAAARRRRARAPALSPAWNAAPPQAGRPACGARTTFHAVSFMPLHAADPSNPCPLGRPRAQRAACLYQRGAPSFATRSCGAQACPSDACSASPHRVPPATRFRTYRAERSAHALSARARPPLFPNRATFCCVGASCGGPACATVHATSHRPAAAIGRLRARLLTLSALDGGLGSGLALPRPRRAPVPQAPPVRASGAPLSSPLHACPAHPGLL